MQPNLTEFVPLPVSLAPTSGPSGTAVTVTGVRFSPGMSVLLAEGRATADRSATATTVTGTVEGEPGRVRLQVGTLWHTSSPLPFTITE